jgi:hypothetical protein
VGCDDFFHVFLEIVVERNSRIPPFCFFENLRNQPSAARRRADYGDWPVVFALDDNFVALLDPLEDSASVAGEFGFRDSERHASLAG